MAILYTLTINNPNYGTVENYPPSVLNSTWAENIQRYLDKTAISSNNKISIIFSTQQELEDFVSNYKLTDPALISDLNAWKSAHGISFSTAYYNLPEITITPIPDFIC